MLSRNDQYFINKYMIKIYQDYKINIFFHKIYYKSTRIWKQNIFDEKTNKKKMLTNNLLWFALIVIISQKYTIGSRGF